MWLPHDWGSVMTAARWKLTSNQDVDVVGIGGIVLLGSSTWIASRKNMKFKIINKHMTNFS